MLAVRPSCARMASAGFSATAGASGAVSARADVADPGGVGATGAAIAQVAQALAALQQLPDPPPEPRTKARKNKRHTAAEQSQMRTALFQAMRVDLTAIPTIEVDTALVVFSEIGPDLSCFPTSAHFCAWLNPAPGTRISGGKRLGRAPMPAVNRVGEALKRVALNARHSDTFIGAAHRARMARMPKACPIKATAHQLARMFHGSHTPSLVSCPHKEFSSVGRIARYDAPSENPSCEQYPARSSREFMKHAG